MKNNGQKLKGFRKQNGYSQAYVGQLIGKDHRTISAYEVGRYPIPDSVVDLLNKKYDLKLKSSIVKKEKVVQTSARTVKGEVVSRVLQEIINKIQEVINYVKE